MFYYTYCIDFIDGFYYYGCRKSKVKPDEDDYVGSPRTHKGKWSTTRFTKRILAHFDSIAKAREHESELIGECYKEDEWCLNCHNAESFYYCGPVSQETKDKRSERVKKGSYKKTPEWRQKISESSKGKRLSEDHRRAISEGLKGKTWVMSDEGKENIKNAALNRPPVSDETKRKISEAGKRRSHSPETKAKIAAALRGKRNNPRGRAGKDQEN